jgi:hypothetical protein
LEIYNEEIRDLLATEKNLKYDIKMCDTKGSDIYVTNLKVIIKPSEPVILGSLTCKTGRCAPTLLHLMSGIRTRATV